VPPRASLADRFADRSHRGKLRVTGPQRAWFLHQVLSQSFEDIAESESRDAAMLTPHGRMLGYLEVVSAGDALLAHFESDLREVLPRALERYVFATRVEIADVTEDKGLVLVTGELWRAAAEESEVVVHPTRSLGVEASYLWVARRDLDALLHSLSSHGLRRADEEELESVRVANGVPRWGREMTTKSFPQEAGIDRVAVHYDKGCYLGQEAMAKIHFRGRVNRRLRRLQTQGRAQEAAEVRCDGERVGSVTSVAEGHALAILRRDVAKDAAVTAGAVPAVVVD
jgi:folate-binding protein YgfZ